MRHRAIVLGMLAIACVVLGGCAPGTAQSGKSQAEAAVSTATASTTTTTAEGGNVKTIYLAGGCFWGLEKYVAQVHGVVNAEVGYANGRKPNATYGDSSGYAEAVKVEYDPEVAPLPFLLDLYYDAIDPTTVNRQGNDMGEEYRTGIYYTDPADKAVIEQSIAELQKKYSKPIAIEVKPLTTYSKAEEYHQKYLDKNPGGYCHIPKKLFDAAAAAKPK